ncbi:MAG: hypothetical protein QF394_09045 [Rhodospirillales bacterium]|nr:hypothetical protein [Rhodospirillales bacterium]MDP7425551.1 hypothetical protein [Rhodospirillales bacterium]MDP7624923.1 hypothetical protein [Rhodospirillales bacterium]
MNDKLYLNLTHGINNAWINIGQRGIKSGDRYWPGIVKKLMPKDKDGKRPYWND